jgi:hypothetical protein
MENSWIVSNPNANPIGVGAAEGCDLLIFSAECLH